MEPSEIQQAVRQFITGSIQLDELAEVLVPIMIEGDAKRDNAARLASDAYLLISEYTAGDMTKAKLVGQLEALAPSTLRIVAPEEAETKITTASVSSRTIHSSGVVAYAHLTHS